MPKNTASALTKSYFNSKVVRLKGRKEDWRLYYTIDFNSKVVRLKVFTQRYAQISQLLFQFQSGTIKSVQTYTETSHCKPFQFQSGTIKSGFYSLLPYRVSLLFQFQSGTIKSPANTTYILDVQLISIPKWYD